MGLPGRGDAWEVPMPGVKGLDSRGWGFGFGVGGAQPSTLVGSRRDVVMCPSFLAGSRRGWWAWLVPEGYFMCLNGRGGWLCRGILQRGGSCILWEELEG